MFDDWRSEGPGAHDFVVRLIDEFLSESSTRLAALADAARRDDAPAVQTASHGLKGAASAVGAYGLAAICDQLETLARTATLDGTPALVRRLDAEYARSASAAQRAGQCRVMDALCAKVNSGLRTCASA